MHLEDGEGMAFQDWCTFTKGVITPKMATGQYGELALATLKELWCLVNKQFAKSMVRRLVEEQF